MSFIIIALKKEYLQSSDWPLLNVSLLAKRLCPYDLPLKQQMISRQIQIYYNDFSELKPQEFRTPGGHHAEPNSAWVSIQFSDEGLHLQTDPLGQCPLWIVETEHFYALSPETKSFSAIPEFNLDIKEDDYFLKVKRRRPDESDFKNIRKLSPGGHLIFNSTRLRIEEITSPLPWHLPVLASLSDLSEAQDLLANALMESANDLPKKNLGSLLSGGIDSSVATYLAKQCTELKSTFNLKTELGSEEADSQETSKYFGLKSETLSYPTDLTRSFFESVIYSNELTDGLTAEILLQMKAVVDLLPVDLENIVTGYGADLLFGGMLGHKAYMFVTGTSDTESLLDRAYWSKELTPFYYWEKRKRLFNLFWHPKVITAALQIPLPMQQIKAEKYVLRSLAVRNQWLTDPLAFRKKTGMTNGTNINFMLSKALVLPSEHEYDQKSKITLDLFKKIYA